MVLVLLRTGVVVALADYLPPLLLRTAVQGMYTVLLKPLRHEAESTMSVTST